MAVRLEEDHPSIVVVGGFDPRVFLPDWLRAQNLLGANEAETAEIKVIHEKITDWSTEWLRLQVTEERLLLEAKVESSAEALRDLATGILSLLDQTVTVALGLNRTMHFDVGGEAAWHKVGDALAPKEYWRDHLKRKPGLLVLQLEEQGRADGLPGKQVVIVQPSPTYQHGVLFNFNSEIRSEAKPGTAFFVEAIRDRWADILADARKTAEAVLEKALS